jgi:CRISPR system Cascade subunit CasD
MPNFTLSFELQAPLQSWGVQSQFGHRETMKEPTKSGVVGLLAAALGRRRHEDITDLASLRMALVVKKEGAILRDFHTAGIDGFLRASGAIERKNPIVSTRFYLADAHFVVALQHEDKTFLEMLEAALRNPIFPLYLGRKSCPPMRLEEHLKIVEADALTTLQNVINALEKPEPIYRFVADIELLTIKEALLIRTQPDHPISFSPRRFALRQTATDYLSPQHNEEA